MVVGFLISSSYAEAIDPTYEFEPNNTTASATAIVLNGIDISGQLSSSKDKDYYSFTAPTGVMKFTIKSATSGSSGSAVASIIDRSGNILSSITFTNFDTAGVTCSANVLAGNYYLVIQSPTGVFKMFVGDYIITPPLNTTPVNLPNLTPYLPSGWSDPESRIKRTLIGIHSQVLQE